MPETAAETLPGNAAEGVAKPNGKMRLLSLDDLDGRTRAAQYCRQVRDEVLADLGGEAGLSTLERCAADHVSVLDAMIRDVGVRWLRGEAVDPAALSSLMNTFNRSAGALGWQRRQRDVTPSLNDYIASRAAEKAGAG